MSVAGRIVAKPKVSAPIRWFTGKDERAELLGTPKGVRKRMLVDSDVASVLWVRAGHASSCEQRIPNRIAVRLFVKLAPALDVRASFALQRSCSKSERPCALAALRTEKRSLSRRYLQSGIAAALALLCPCADSPAAYTSRAPRRHNADSKAAFVPTELPLQTPAFWTGNSPGRYFRLPPRNSARDPTS